MKTKMRSILIVTALLFSLTALGQRSAGRRSQPDSRQMLMKKEFRASVDRAPFLTEEQQKAAQAIRLETASQLKPLRDELRELTARQRTLTTAKDADLDAINAHIEKMAAKRVEMAKIMASQKQQIRSLLTDEQLLRFDNRDFRGRRGVSRPLGTKRNDYRKHFRSGVRG